MKKIPYTSRELSWLDFNKRVLAEARKKSNPVLERLKFLGITASNLDEFFMVRMAYLYDKSKSGNDRSDAGGMTAYGQLQELIPRVNQFELDQLEILSEIEKDLKKEHIFIKNMNQLTENQKKFVKELFDSEYFPVLTPLAVDPGRPFPSLSNAAIQIAVRLGVEESEDVFGVVSLPSILPRFILLPSEEGNEFLPLEKLIIHYLSTLFDGYEVKASGVFRVIRSADFDASEDTEDIMEEMLRTVKKRKKGRPIRLELSEKFDPEIFDFLKKMLDPPKKVIIELPGMLGLSSLSKIAGLSGRDDLRLPPITPVEGEDFVGYTDLFECIKERDRMIHMPYESFNTVIDFIKAAAEDSDVLAIKQTLYRVSGNSPIIEALERAAENGKAVTVLVELKARFDEENNIQWARRLEQAGCHVIYGLTGLKTHCKILLVVRKESSGIRRYLHLSTGNYNDVTARFYTDIGMFTCRNTFGADASALFNHLTGFSRSRDYHKLITAPTGMRTFFLDRIDREIQNQKRGLPSGISIKVNSLLDEEMIIKLYEASQEGVSIKLLVRGICSLIPKIEGVSENIRVRSVVGQLLEHSRIFTFENGGDPLYYLGSADLMPRNLDRRVELLFPVEEQMLKEQIQETLDLLWSDNTNAWEQESDGVYREVDREGKKLCAQNRLAKLAKDRYEKALRQWENE